MGRGHMRKLINRRSGALLLASLLLAVVGPMPAAAGGPVFTFYFTTPGGCVSGNGPASVGVYVTLRSANGTFEGRGHDESDGAGNFNVCNFYDSIDPGDVLTAKSGVNQRSFTVPNVAFNVNRVTDVVSG